MTTSEATLQVRVDDGFAEWMSHFSGSLAITTYQAGKIVLVGWDGRQVTILPRTFDKPMGLAVAPLQAGRPLRFALATRHEVVQFANAPLLAPDFQPTQRGRYDSLFLPRTSHFSGDLNVHDLAYAEDGLWVVNTRFCCLAKLSDEFNFIPEWKPPFVTAIVPEDRCHLNGLCVVDGKPKYVTCLGETDVAGGWRSGKASGGVVLDVSTNEVVTRGLAMPHSPRWHANQLWVLNSGAGELCAVDPKDGRRVVVATLPGYLRGLRLVGNWAMVGLCKIRETHIFGGLPVQQSSGKLLCGVAIIDLASGRQAGLLQFTAGCEELFDMQILPNIRRPMILNREREEARQAFAAPDFAYWLRPENLILDSSEQSV